MNIQGVLSQEVPLWLPVLWGFLAVLIIFLGGTSGGCGRRPKGKFPSKCSRGTLCVGSRGLKSSHDPHHRCGSCRGPSHFCSFCSQVPKQTKSDYRSYVRKLFSKVDTSVEISPQQISALRALKQGERHKACLDNNNFSHALVSFVDYVNSENIDPNPLDLGSINSKPEEISGIPLSPSNELSVEEESQAQSECSQSVEPDLNSDIISNVSLLLQKALEPIHSSLKMCNQEILILKRSREDGVDPLDTHPPPEKRQRRDSESSVDSFSQKSSSDESGSESDSPVSKPDSDSVGRQASDMRNLLWSSLPGLQPSEEPTLSYEDNFVGSTPRGKTEPKLLPIPKRFLQEFESMCNKPKKAVTPNVRKSVFVKHNFFHEAIDESLPPQLEFIKAKKPSNPALTEFFTKVASDMPKLAHASNDVLGNTLSCIYITMLILHSFGEDCPSQLKASISLLQSLLARIFSSSCWIGMKTSMLRRQQFIAKWGIKERSVIESIINLSFPLGELFGPELATFVKDQASAAKDSKDLLQAWGLNQKNTQSKSESRFGGDWSKKSGKGQGKQKGGRKFPKKGNAPSSSRGGKGGGGK